MLYDGKMIALWVILLAYSLFGTVLGLTNSWKKKNPFGLCRWFLPLGAFVWGDLVVLGPFWLIVSGLILWTQQWLMAWIIISLFWTLRSLGEMIYWFNEQFAINKRNKVADLLGHQLFGESEAVYFGYQVLWTVVATVFMLMTIYATTMWIKGV